MPSDQSRNSAHSSPQASPEQIRWLRSPAGLWHRIEQAFLGALADHEERLRADASAFGLEPDDDLQVPLGNPEELLRAFVRANPGIDPRNPPKDPYELALGVLRMLPDL